MIFNFWPVRSKIWTARCKHSGRLNFWTVKAWLHGWMVTQLRDAILNLLRLLSAHEQMVKPLTKAMRTRALEPRLWQNLEFNLVRQFRAMSTKSVWTKFPLKLFNRSKIRPAVPCGRSRGWPCFDKNLCPFHMKIMPASYHKNNMIYIIKQEELYQNMVNSTLVSTCNCKMDY